MVGIGTVAGIQHDLTVSHDFNTNADNNGDVNFVAAMAAVIRGLRFRLWFMRRFAIAIVVPVRLAAVVAVVPMVVIVAIIVPVRFAAIVAIGAMMVVMAVVVVPIRLAAAIILVVRLFPGGDFFIAGTQPAKGSPAG